MKVNAEELTDYIRGILQGIQNAVSESVDTNGDSEDFSLTSPVKFKLGITNSQEIGGEVKIFVAGIHAGIARGEVNQIEFELSDSGAVSLAFLEKSIGIWEQLTADEKKAIIDGLRSFFSALKSNREGTSATG